MKKWRIALILIAFVCLTVNAVESKSSKQSNVSKGGAGVQTKTFQVNKGGTLQVSIDSGDIWITSWEKDEIFIKADGIDDADIENLEMRQSGETVSVKFYGGDGWSHYVRFDIQVPSKFNMNLHTSGGDIRLQGNLSGSIRGNTSGGDIRLGDVSGRLEMSTSGGDIIGGQVDGDAILRTSGGDIQVGSITSKVDLNTSGGDITVGNVGSSLKASTAGGDIHVGDVGGEATVSTAGGDIQIGKVSGSASMKTAGGDIILQSASGTVTAKTAGGDVVLKNVTGSVIGETAGGDVMADIIPSGKGSSRLSTAGGDVVLKVPANAKATIEARIRIRGRWKDSKEDYSVISDFKASEYVADDDQHEIRATYLLNGGGETISLQTVNGDIYIRTLQK